MRPAWAPKVTDFDDEGGGGYGEIDPEAMRKLEATTEGTDTLLDTPLPDVSRFAAPSKLQESDAPDDAVPPLPDAPPSPKMNAFAKLADMGAPKAPTDYGNDDDRALIEEGAGKDRTAGMLRAFDTGSKQLSAAFGGLPKADESVVGPTSFEKDARGIASQNEAKRYQRSQGEIAAAHQRAMTERQARVDQLSRDEKLKADKRAEEKDAYTQRKDESDADFKERQLKSQEMRAEKHDKAMVDAAKEGKAIPSTGVTDLADFATAEKSLADLGKSFDTLGMGGTMAKLSDTFIPEAAGRTLGTDVAKYNAGALLAMQNVGKIMESGKLAASDETKYKRMLPQAGDADGLARQKILNARDYLKDLYDNRVTALKAAGYNAGSLAGKSGGTGPSPSGNRPTMTNKKTGERRYVNPDGTLGEVVK